MSILSVIEQLRATSSRNEKIQILKDNDSPLLRSVIFHALDPLTQFYIRKIPEYTPWQHEDPPFDLQTAVDNLQAIIFRDITGHRAIAFLRSLLESLHPEDSKVLELIIQKDLKCGVAGSTVNKAFGDMIYDYPIMLCEPLNEKNIKNITFPALSQTKEDGMRFNAIVNGRDVTYYSRNGKLIDLENSKMDVLVREIAKHYGNTVVLDGELLLLDPVSGVAKRETGNGILNKAVKGTISQEEKDMVFPRFWDAVELPDFHARFSDISYQSRFSKLTLAVHAVDSRMLVDSVLVFNLEEANSHYATVIAAGGEGTILKNVSSPWEDRRVNHQLKMKEKISVDLRCIGWVRGTGKHEGLMGALMLATENGGVQVNVGTGFTDHQRKTIKPDDVLGKIVEITYNAVTQDKRTGQRSLFLPVFVGIREDKNEADNL